MLNTEHGRKQSLLPHVFYGGRLMPFDVEDKEIQSRNPSFGDEVGAGDCPHLIIHKSATVANQLRMMFGLEGKATVPKDLLMLVRDHGCEAR
jgi:hypothetical protein